MTREHIEHEDTMKLVDEIERIASCPKPTGRGDAVSHGVFRGVHGSYIISTPKGNNAEINRIFEKWEAEREPN